MLSVGLGRQWKSLRVEGNVALGGTYGERLLVLEPSIEIAGMGVIDLWGISLLGGVQLAAVWHGFTHGDTGGGHLYARVGLPLGVEWSRWGIWLVPHFRSTPIEHYLGNQMLFESDYWGITLLLAAKLFPT